MFEAAVPNEDGALRSGSFSQADVVLDEQSQAIAIPVSAMVRFAGVQKVWKVVDGKVKEAVVEVGEENKEFVEIRHGLRAGETVLLDGRGGGVGKYKNTNESLAAPEPTQAESTPVSTAPVSTTPVPVSGTAPQGSTSQSATRNMGAQVCIG